MRAVAVHRGAEEEAQHTAHFVVELLLCELPALDELFVGVGQIVVVVGILGACRQTIGPCAELHIKTVADGLLRVVGTTPVADDHTVVLPVAFQYLVKQLLVVAVMLVLVEVVGTHESPDVSFSDCSLEGGQIDFVEGAVGEDDVHLMAILLVVVHGVVLYAGRHTFRLQSLNIRSDHAGGEVGIFAHVFEVATPQRSTQDVHTRTQNHGFVAVESLLAEVLAVETCHRGIPCGCQTGKGREGHTRVVRLSCLFPFVPEHIGAYTVRPVVGPEIRKTKALHTWAGELTLSVNDSYLLVECHALECIFDTLFDGFCVVEI